MNNVSWLIYLSNISGNIGGLLIFIGIAVFIIAGVYFGISIALYDDLNKWDTSEETAGLLKKSLHIRRFVPALLVLACTLWVLAALCPRQETVLAIAASEIGEKVLESPTGNLAIKALNAWLQRQIAPPPAPTPATSS